MSYVPRRENKARSWRFISYAENIPSVYTGCPVFDWEIQLKMVLGESNRSLQVYMKAILNIEGVAILQR